MWKPDDENKRTAASRRFNNREPRSSFFIHFMSSRGEGIRSKMVACPRIPFATSFVVSHGLLWSKSSVKHSEVYFCITRAMRNGYPFSHLIIIRFPQDPKKLSFTQRRDSVLDVTMPPYRLLTGGQKVSSSNSPLSSSGVGEHTPFFASKNQWNQSQPVNFPQSQHHHQQQHHGSVSGSRSSSTDHLVNSSRSQLLSGGVFYAGPMVHPGQTSSSTSSSGQQTPASPTLVTMPPQRSQVETF